MSIVIDVNKLTDFDKEEINKQLKIKIENKYSYGPPRYIYPYILTDNNITIPFAFAVSTLKNSRKNRISFDSIQNNFKGVLREEQKEVKKESIQTLNKKGSVILSMYCGFGKTITSINLACSIKLKVLVIVNKIVLMKQWKDSILTFCPDNTVSYLKPKGEIYDSDFCIVNAINVEKFDKSIFDKFGLVIVDEAHLIMAETVSKCLNCVSPRYLIGLTATPYRPDGLDKLLEFYFGKNKIIRKLNRKHIVYTVETGFQPTIEQTTNGRVNWGIVLDSQANNEKRNNIIIDIICKFKDRTFMIIVKRVSQAEYLSNKLIESNEKVSLITGSTQTYDINDRVLIGTAGKIGTGFDHPKIDALIIAADVQEYFIQYLGRCMRTKTTEPIVFDLIDDYSLLKKHYNTRKKIYKEHGGIIHKYTL